MVDNADTVVLVPMLGRAHRVAPLLASLHAASPGVRVLFCCTFGDVDVHAAVDAVGAERLDVPRSPVGDYARKINAGYRATKEPLLFTGACDLKFHPGWLDAAKAHLADGIGVVGTNDLGNPRVLAGEHATHSLITRDYADRHGTIDGPGQVLAECYPHEYVDDELIGTAQMRHAFAMAMDSVVEHEHPDWGKAPFDSLYLGQNRRMALGRRVYNRRRWRWA